MWISVVRYYVALVILIGLQYGILMWLVIHPLALAKRASEKVGNEAK